jgi:hypothetical protein
MLKDYMGTYAGLLEFANNIHRIEKVTSRQVNMVEKIFKEQNKTDKKLTYDNIVFSSRDAANVFLWVTAILEYYHIFKNVKPLLA